MWTSESPSHGQLWQTVLMMCRFSAPLTPTIRRYLNLPAGNGAAAKGKAKAAAPARQPASIATTSAQSGKPEPSAKAQHHRVAALATKPSRAALKSAAAPVVAPHPVSRDQHGGGPSRQHRSPVKPVEVPAYEPKTPHPRSHARQVETPDHADSHATNRPPAPHAVQPRRPDNLVAPPFGRSASHTVLSTTDLVHSSTDRNPLHNPTRPALPQSYSTTSLPAENHEMQIESQRPAPAPVPTRPSRFATGPVRIVRPAPLASSDESTAENPPISIDGFFYTPSGATVLRGPVRPPPTVGHGRRPMGQAQRRVVTAPESVGSENMPTKTPAVRRTVSRSVRERVEELDERAASASPTKSPGAVPTRVEPNSGPSSPSQRKDLEDGQRPGTQTTQIVVEEEEAPSSSMTKPAQDQDGLDPVVLAAQIRLPPEEAELIEGEAHNQAVSAHDRETPDAASIEIEAAEGPIKSAEAEAVDPMTKEKTSPTSTEAVSLEPQDAEGAVPCTGDEVRSKSGMRSGESAAPVVQTYDKTLPAHQPCGSGDKAEQTSALKTEQHEVLSVDKQRISPSIVSNSTSISNTVLDDDKKSAARSAAATARTVSGSARPPQIVPDGAAAHLPVKTAPTTTAPPRKPPVPRAAAAARPARPIDRKAFRPVTAAESAAAARATAAKEKATARSAAPRVGQADGPSRSTQPSEVVARTRVVSAQSRPPSSTGQARAVDKDEKEAKESVPRTTDSTTTRPTKASTLLAPTKASASRATASTHPHPPAKSVSTAPASTIAALPPVRKEKIKLKAALPSFRPVRQAAAVNAGSSTTGPAKSAASSTSSSAPTRRPGVKVKPECIPLPASPAKDFALAASTASVVLAKSPSSAGSGRAKVRPDAIPLPASPAALPSLPQDQATHKSPSRHGITAKVKPEQVPLPTSPSTADRDSKQYNSASTPLLNDLGLPMPIPDRFESSSNRSKSSAAPTASDLSDFDTDMEDEDDLTGVTFKMRSADVGARSTRPRPSADSAPPRPRVIQQAKSDLMEFSFSTPARNHRSGSARSTPNKLVSPVAGGTTPKYTPNRRALGFMDANVRSPLVASLVQGHSGQ